MFTSVSYSFVGPLAGHFPIICFNYARHSTPSLVAVLLYLPLMFMGRLSPSPSLVQLFTGSFLLMSWSFNMLYHASEQESNIEAWSPTVCNYQCSFHLPTTMSLIIAHLGGGHKTPREESPACSDGDTQGCSTSCPVHPPVNLNNSTWV